MNPAFRNSALSTIALLAAGCGIQKEQPNFVFILVDDLGWADVACNNPASFYETPNIDRLAESGIRFTQAYAASPVCSPTRASLLTGKYPTRVSITDWIPGDDPQDRPLLGPADRNELDLAEITFAELLHQKGYRTGYIGKWHLGDTGFFPENQGFDLNIGGYHKGSPVSYYSPYKNPRLTDGPEGEYLTDRLTDESIRFIKENSNRPFLLYLSFYTVHTPLQAAKKHFEHFREKREKMGFYDVPAHPEGEGFTHPRQDNAVYASMVAAMDENVGRIVETLRNQGLDKNTWIIFTSDNGGLSTLRRGEAPTCNDPLRAGKGWCYEGGIRVPLIMAGPGLKNPGTVSGTPVISMDFFPTILNLAKINAPANDGQNLVPLLTRDQPLDREKLFWHFPHYHGSGWKPGSAYRNGDWKIVVHYEENYTELFNLAADPYETDDLAAQMPEKRDAMKAELEQLLKEANGQLPSPNSAYQAAP